MSLKDEYQEKLSVILDPSLLSPNGLELIEGLIEEQSLDLNASHMMVDMLSDRNTLRSILTHWGLAPWEISYSINEIEDLELLSRINRPKSDLDLDFDLPKFDYEIRKFISRRKIIIDFLAEEIAFAIRTRLPIICGVSSPEWRIVEYFKKMGAKVNRIIELSGEEKKNYLGTKDFRKLAISSAVGVAFVWVIGDLPAAFAAAGPAAINLIVQADP